MLTEGGAPIARQVAPGMDSTGLLSCASVVTCMVHENLRPPNSPVCKEALWNGFQNVCIGLCIKNWYCEGFLPMRSLKSITWPTPKKPQVAGSYIYCDRGHSLVLSSSSIPRSHFTKMVEWLLGSLVSTFSAGNQPVELQTKQSSVS